MEVLLLIDFKSVCYVGKAYGACFDYQLGRSIWIQCHTLGFRKNLSTTAKRAMNFNFYLPDDERKKKIFQCAFSPSLPSPL
jgi:hypothetical protein